MKRKIVVVLSIIFLAIWVAIGIYFIVIKFNVKEIATAEIEKKLEKPVVTEISLVAVGDALIHDGVYNAAKTENGYDFKPMFSLIKEISKDSDLAFYNQESILGGSLIGLSNYPRFNSPFEVGDALIDAGFNLVSRANNHTLDRGEVAILNADAYWKKQTDVLTAGSYISEAERTEVIIKEVKGIKYALLAYTTTTNGLKAPLGKESYVNVYDKEKAKTDIVQLRNQVDVLIVSMHWGSEYTFTPTVQEIEIAKELAALDVDIILGHHPHVVQPVQYVEDTLVVYSMGNLISAQTELMKRVGLLVSLNITKTSFKGESSIVISNVTGTLLYNPARSTLGKYVVYPFDKVDNGILSNYQSVYEQYSKYIKVDDTIIIKGLQSQS